MLDSASSQRAWSLRQVPHAVCGHVTMRVCVCGHVHMFASVGALALELRRMKIEWT